MESNTDTGFAATKRRYGKIRRKRSIERNDRYCIPTTIRYKSDDNDVATRQAIQSVQSILLLIQPERELCVVFFEPQFVYLNTEEHKSAGTEEIIPVQQK